MRTLLASSLLLPVAWLAAGAGASAGDPDEGGSAWTKTLRGGQTVELVGISAHPSGEGTWFSPDGEPLADRPYERVNALINRPDLQRREFVVRLGGFDSGSGPDEAPSVAWGFDPGGPTSYGGVEPSVPETRDLRATAAGLPEGRRTCTLRVGVASGPWETLASSDGRGLSSAGTADGEIMFARPHATDRGTALAVADTLQGVEARVVAIDEDDRPHTPSSAVSSASVHLRLRDVEFELPPEQVKSFRFQIRKYEWVEFKDVPLAPRRGGG